MKGHRWFAAVYDLMNQSDEKVIGPLRARFLSEVHGRALEIGAGTGASFSYYPAGAIIVATEPDPFMLRRAVKRARALSRPIQFVQCSAEALPFVDGTFDTAVATVVL